MVNISKDAFKSIIERMASYGTAPEEGCSIFGVGYENAFTRIKNMYLEDSFRRGRSSEKYVMGPFGSGKTHFLRELMEIARDMDCVTSEVPLDKNIDFTKVLVVYSEVIKELKMPNTKERGITGLLNAAIKKARNKINDKDMEDILIGEWLDGIDKIDYKLDTFGKVIKKGLVAIVEEDNARLDLCTRWLSGDFNDKDLSKNLGISKVEQSSNNIYANRAMLSLFQFIKYVGFKGTVVCFDEAEQGLTVDKKKTQRILSMLQADINRIADLDQGSAFIVYAITPDLYEKMKNYPALQQRISSPQGMGFFDGCASSNTRAPLIDLRQDDPLQDLVSIGRKLVGVLYSLYGDEINIPKEDVIKCTDDYASSIAERNMSSSSRRDMVKETCSLFLELLDRGELQAGATKDELVPEDLEV